MHFAVHAIRVCYHAGTGEDRDRSEDPLTRLAGWSGFHSGRVRKNVPGTMRNLNISDHHAYCTLPAVPVAS